MQMRVCIATYVPGERNTLKNPSSVKRGTTSRESRCSLEIHTRRTTITNVACMFMLARMAMATTHAEVQAQMRHICMPTSQRRVPRTHFYALGSE
eukprot:3455867-Pyramimonas_sp.AAC.1